MYRIIRVGKGFDPVLAVTPVDADYSTPNAHFYLLDWLHATLDKKPLEFEEIDRSKVLSYFSGHADGLGFEFPPDQDFSSLEDLKTFIEEKWNESARNRLAKLENKEEG